MRRNDKRDCRWLAAMPAAAAFPLIGFGAQAKDRPVTDQERMRLETALREVGCSGSKMEFDDDPGRGYPQGKFEVDDSICADGVKYDLTFDPQFRLLTKKRD